MLIHVGEEGSWFRMVESAVESLNEAILGLIEKAPLLVLHLGDDSGFLNISNQCLEMKNSMSISGCLRGGTDYMGETVFIAKDGKIIKEAGDASSQTADESHMIESLEISPNARKPKEASRSLELKSGGMNT